MRTKRTVIGLAVAAAMAGGIVAAEVASASEIFYDFAPVTAPGDQITTVPDAAPVAEAAQTTPSPIFYDF